MPSVYIAAAALFVLGIALVAQVSLALRYAATIRFRAATRATAVSLVLVLIEAVIAIHFSYMFTSGPVHVPESYGRSVIAAMNPFLGSMGP